MKVLHKLTQEPDGSSARRLSLKVNIYRLLHTNINAFTVDLYLFRPMHRHRLGRRDGFSSRLGPHQLRMHCSPISPAGPQAHTNGRLRDGILQDVSLTEFGTQAS